MTNIFQKIEQVNLSIDRAKQKIKQANEDIEMWEGTKEHINTLWEDCVVRGFGISKKTQDRIDTWKEAHKQKCSCNYFDYIFSPSAVGTMLDVKCHRCGAFVECNCSNNPMYRDDIYDEENNCLKWKV